MLRIRCMRFIKAYREKERIYALMKISVIIPIYNIEDLLEQCIDSVVSQLYEDKEIILVDDGSTDSSPMICDNYAKRYEFVKVIHKENGGVSAARNEGIRLATGDYIMFLDSDDYWNDRAALQKIMKHLGEQQCDVAIMGTTSLYCHSNHYVENHINMNNNVIDNLEVLNYAVSKRIYISAVWDKIIKKTMFEAEDLFFVEGITSEDYDWCLRLLLKNPSIKLIDEVFLVHRLGRTGSIQSVSKGNNRALESFEHAFHDCISILSSFDGEEKVKDTGEMFVSHMYLQLLGFVTLFSKKMSKEKLKKLRKYLYLLDYDEIASVRKAKCVYTLFGYSIMCWLLSCRVSYIRTKRNKL